MPAASVGVASPARIEPSVARDEAEKRDHAYRDFAEHHRQGVHPLLFRHRGAELGIPDAAAHQIDDVDAGQQEAGAERRGVKVRHRHAEHRSHDDQHHRWRDEDAERAASRDGAGGELGVVARLDHDRRGHDAEHGHRRADDAGRHGKHGGRQHHHQIERAAHRSEQEAEGREETLHQARLLGDEAHEDEERHGRQQLLLHHADGLEVGQVEDHMAHADVAEGEGEKKQREGDRHANENRPEQDEQHHKADECIQSHTSTFSLCSSSTPVRAM